MDRRDQELLDKQLWGVSPQPPGSGGALGFIALATFCAGIAIGSLLFTHPPKSPQISWRSGSTAILLPHGVPPTSLQ